MKLQTHVLLPLLLLSAPAVADEKPTAEQMLASFQKTVEGVSTFRIETVEKSWMKGTSDERVKDNKDGYVGTDHHALCSDGSRWRLSRDSTQLLRFNEMTGEHRSGVEYLIGDYLGKRQVLHAQWIADDDKLNSKFRKISVWLADDTQPEDIRRFLGQSNILFGRTVVDGPGPLWETMAEASSLALSSEMALVGEVPTHVLKSRGRYGVHTLWLDPAAGYLPRRIVVDKHPGDLSGDAQLGVEDQPRVPAPRRANAPRLPKRVLDELHIEWNDIQIAERKGRHVITGFDLKSRSKIRVDDQPQEIEQRIEYRVTNVDLAPEEWTPDAFLPSVQIPEGTRVATEDVQARFIWSNGEVRKGE